MDEKRLPNRWKCSLHGVVGRFDDGSLSKHEDEEHGGLQIATMMFREEDE